MKVKVKCRLCGTEQIKEVGDLRMLGREYCIKCLTVSEWGMTVESRKPCLQLLEILEENK